MTWFDVLCAVAGILLGGILFLFVFGSIRLRIFFMPIYKSMSFRLKYMCMYVLMKCRRQSSIPDEDFDKVHVLADDPLVSFLILHEGHEWILKLIGWYQAVDAVYFNTSSSDSTILVFSFARRRNGIVNSMGFFKCPKYSDDLFTIPAHPQSTLYQTKAEEENMKSFTASGIKLTPIRPMKEWQIEYDGEMKSARDPKQTIRVRIDATWFAEYKSFDFSRDISTSAMSKAIAAQKWSREYFHDLKL